VPVILIIFLNCHNVSAGTVISDCMIRNRARTPNALLGAYALSFVANS
jgi:hypothetical protein